MTIKMSDVFYLPLPLDGIRESNGDSSWQEATAIAINSYDDNQERIKAQQQTNVELSDVMAKMQVGMQDEIDQLKLLLDLSEKKHNRLIDRAKSAVKIEEQVNGLKAQVGELILFISKQSDYCFDKIERNGETIRPKVLAHEAVVKAPRQCLASVKADAVKEFVASGVSPNSKAGCIGEFTMTSVQTCPECWQKQDDDCELCNGATDENGQGEIELDIPWTDQKDIFKAMLEFKHEYYINQIREAANE